MARTTPAKSIRNGFKWRDGRPRWEPSKANRKAGIKGRDLKDGRRWLDRGEAIDVCDLRHAWAQLLRLAITGEAAARAQLQAATLALQTPPKDAAQQLRRHLLSDLISRATALLSLATPPMTPAPASRTVRAMVDGYFADPPLKADASTGKMRRPEASTLKAYRTQSKKLLAAFGEREAASIAQGELRGWYLELCAGASVATANQALATAGAMFQWAAWQTPPWIARSPATELGKTKPAGRIVFWTMAEERAFVGWCDAHGYADVADAATFILWTGALPVDMCRANLPDLAGDTWRHVRWKTRRKRIEAMPGLLEPVKVRVRRREAEDAAAAVTRLDRPFLVRPSDGARHGSATLTKRFADAKAGALAARAAPPSFADKRLADGRDTCLSRLAWAGVPLSRIPSWSGHSLASAQNILREHYLALRETEALEDAAKLAAWAEKEGMQLG